MFVARFVQHFFQTSLNVIRIHRHTWAHIHDGDEDEEKKFNRPCYITCKCCLANAPVLMGTYALGGWWDGFVCLPVHLPNAYANSPVDDLFLRPPRKKVWNFGRQRDGKSDGVVGTISLDINTVSVQLFSKTESASRQLTVSVVFGQFENVLGKMKFMVCVAFSRAK